MFIIIYFDNLFNSCILFIFIFIFINVVHLQLINSQINNNKNYIHIRKLFRQLKVKNIIIDLFDYKKLKKKL